MISMPMGKQAGSTTICSLWAGQIGVEPVVMLHHGRFIFSDQIFHMLHTAMRLM